MSVADDPWIAGDYELVFEIATGMPAMHEHLVQRLRPGSGVQWLDLATGTGRVAFAAGSAGAHVTGLDASPSMIERARRLAGGRALDVRFEVGDCQSLPYEDGAFDVVSSAVGAIFAPDHRAVAAELARVCRKGGMIGIVSWRPDDEFKAIFEPFEEPSPPGAGDYADWGREGYVDELLGHDFALRFEEGNAAMTGESGSAMWDVWLRAMSPTRILYDSLAPVRRVELRESFVSYFERFRTRGGIDQPNRYLLILGRRI